MPPALRSFFLAAALAGCSALQTREDPGRLGAAGAGERRLLEVPFFPDRTDQCGPSALASVLSFWGDAAGPAALKEEVYLRSLRGSLPLDLLLAAKGRGFKVHLYGGSIEDLKAELRLGHPLVAFLNRGFDAAFIGHYVVVAGYDEGKKGLYVHSGAAKDRLVPYGRFLKDWEKTDRSTLLILPPSRDKESPHAAS